MQIDNTLLIIVAMAVVTYIPRAFPFLLFREIEYSPFLKNVLKNVRYAILGGLIFPGLFMVQKDPLFGLIGGTIAFVLAYLNIDIVLVVLGAVCAMTVYSLL